MKARVSCPAIPSPPVPCWLSSLIGNHDPVTGGKAAEYLAPDITFARHNAARHHDTALRACLALSDRHEIEATDAAQRRVGKQDRHALSHGQTHRQPSLLRSSASLAPRFVPAR